MAIFNGFILTALLSLFSVSASSAETVSFDENPPVHHIQNASSFNNLAISSYSISEILAEITNYNTDKSLVISYKNTALIERFLEVSNTIKAPGFLNLHLTISVIIFPFHYFL